MTDIVTFANDKFGSVRTVNIEGNILFCGSDVAKMLGYSNTRKALIDHCKGVTKRYIPTSGGTQELSFITEGDVYRLITSSKLPAAQEFESWVYDEVLPTIRKTGSYTIPSKPKEEIEAILVQAHSENAKILRELANEYSGKSENYKQILDAYASKEITGTFALPLPTSDKKTYSASEVGTMLGISANKVGSIAIKNSLKTDTYGMWVHDKSKYSGKEVDSFRYFENAIPVIGNLSKETA